MVLGLDNSGKTTILKKLSEEDIDHIMPTQVCQNLYMMIHLVDMLICFILHFCHIYFKFRINMLILLLFYCRVLILRV